jgi:hypothetical protein
VIVVLVAAVLAAGFLVACGSSDSDTGTASTTTEGGGGSKSETATGGGSRSVATPLKVSGGGSGQFRSKGGDNSIQNFGEEGDESELQEAAEALHGFYVARAEEDWAKACSYLSKTVVNQLRQLASQSSQLKGKGCAVVLHAFTRSVPASVRRKTTIVDAGSLRNDGEQAFLIYYGEGHAPYAMPMKEEGGEWKVGLLAGTPLS